MPCAYLRGWIGFFLVAVEKQSNKNIEKVQEILKLYESLKDDFINIPTPKNAIKVLDFLFSKPIFDSKDFIESVNIPKRNGFRILKYISDEQIVSDNGRTRNKTYFFDALIKIII